MSCLDPRSRFLIEIIRSMRNGSFGKVWQKILKSCSCILDLLVKLIVVNVVDKCLVHLLVEYFDFLLFKRELLNYWFEFAFACLIIPNYLVEFLFSDHMKSIWIELRVGWSLSCLLAWIVSIFVVFHHSHWPWLLADIFFGTCHFLAWHHHAPPLSWICVCFAICHFFVFNCCMLHRLSPDFA